MATALITGASMGLGAEIARVLAAKGIDLFLVARSKDKLDALAAELREAHGIKVHPVKADLTDARVRAALCEKLGTTNIQVDVLVNNAGFGINGAFATNDVQRELAQVELNVAALTDLTHRLLQPMIERGTGRVLNIASTAAFLPGPYMAVYYATKAYVLSFSEALAYELKDTGVTVTAHCPGATETEFARSAGSADTLLFKKSVAKASDVARHAVAAMEKGESLAIHGFRNRLLAFLTRFGPRRLLCAITTRPRARRAR